MNEFAIDYERLEQGFQYTRDHVLALLNDGTVYLVTAVACYVFRIHYAYPLFGVGLGIALTGLFLQGVDHWNDKNIYKYVVEIQNWEVRHSPYLRITLAVLPILFSPYTKTVALLLGFAFGCIHKLACDALEEEHEDNVNA